MIVQSVKSEALTFMCSAIRYLGITKSESRSHWPRDLRRRFGAARLLGVRV